MDGIEEEEEEEGNWESRDDAYVGLAYVEGQIDTGVSW